MFTGFPANTTNCFQPAYESAATSYIGQNPDLATVPVGQGQPGSFIATYGVPVIDISSFLTAGTQALTIELDDAGGDLGAAALHLVTNCTLAGTVPGGSITGNPVNTNDPSSQTQTFTFDNGGGQNIGFTTSTSTAQQQGTVTIPNGTVPIVTDIGIPQNLFSQLVKNKSAAPAVCLRLTGETDPFGQPMCKGYLIQCQSPGINGTVSGDNCVPNAYTVRTINCRFSLVGSKENVDTEVARLLADVQVAPAEDLRERLKRTADVEDVGQRLVFLGIGEQEIA